MILLKVAITIAIVTVLSLVAERVSPRAAGILSGYPLGSAISLFFIGLERGDIFAGASAVYNMAGMSALLSFLYIYYRVSARIGSRRRWVVILFASLAAALSFFLVDGLLQLVFLPAAACVLIAAAAIIGYGIVFRRIPNARIIQKVHLGPGVILFRASLAALMILAITGAAGLVPPSWAGLFSAFPATLFPLLLIMHTTYGVEQAHTIIKNVPTGLWSLTLYSLTVSFAYPRLGLYWGTLTGFAVATLYLLALAFLTRRRELAAG